VATFVVAHGAWSAGWAWKKVRPLLRAAGHEVWTPTYTGIGERHHLANEAVDLELHIADILNLLEFEDLRDIVLVGHSYGGIVATGVADRAPERLQQLIYVDAFVPRNGQGLVDMSPPDQRDRWRERARAEGDGWRIPYNPIPPDTSEEDVAWITKYRMAQPLKCFEQRLRLSREPAMPRSYVYCTRIAPGDIFRQFADRARSEPGWRYFEIDASHSPHVTAPRALCALLERIAAGAG
jgi:pimeloyl-ACP methyl ester carboxylesterase